MTFRGPARTAARSLLTATALVALIATGCSNAPAETDSGGDENAEAAPNPERAGKLPEFARCMRDNGVEDFPDPDADGVIKFHGGADTPEFRSARETCRAVLPDGLGTEQRTPGGGG